MVKRGWCTYAFLPSKQCNPIKVAKLCAQIPIAFVLDDTCLLLSFSNSFPLSTASYVFAFVASRTCAGIIRHPHFPVRMINIILNF
ncbi:hypothetical protein NC653_024565 [Populus alba x Populus x berolinensis]|uniref:Uncharacterized protein n=1 Tax=Populus alba x Populus x berolinensis TaxID=444605 RepID=A0AAD6Q8U1_9ROSI|nr:hypothetical protein NC653_024565 [Populus alba x Populus x berolinensis]